MTYFTSADKDRNDIVQRKIFVNLWFAIVFITLIFFKDLSE